jgi:hypothetical protein
MVTKNSYVVTTEDVTTVYVNEDLYKEIVVSDYFKKELIRKIPALESIMVKRNAEIESDIMCTICVKMAISTVLNNKPQNTVFNIEGLMTMGNSIINIIKANGRIPLAVNAIARDCKPWFKDESNDKEPA